MNIKKRASTQMHGQMFIFFINIINFTVLSHFRLIIKIVLFGLNGQLILGNIKGQMPVFTL